MKHVFLDMSPTKKTYIKHDWEAVSTPYLNTQFPLLLSNSWVMIIAVTNLFNEHINYIKHAYKFKRNVYVVPYWICRT